MSGNNSSFLWFSVVKERSELNFNWNRLSRHSLHNANENKTLQCWIKQEHLHEQFQINCFFLQNSAITRMVSCPVWAKMAAKLQWFIWFMQQPHRPCSTNCISVYKWTELTCYSYMSVNDMFAYLTNVQHEIHSCDWLEINGSDGLFGSVWQKINSSFWGDQ